MRKHVLRMVAGSTVRVTPPALEKTLIETHGLTKKQVKAVIRDLVSDGELAYTYEFGSTFLEPSFIKAYGRKNFEVVWQEKELDWRGVVLKRQK